MGLKHWDQSSLYVLVAIDCNSATKGVHIWETLLNQQFAFDSQKLSWAYKNMRSEALQLIRLSDLSLFVCSELGEVSRVSAMEYLDERKRMRLNIVLQRLYLLGAPKVPGLKSISRLVDNIQTL